MFGDVPTTQPAPGHVDHAGGWGSKPRQGPSEKPLQVTGLNMKERGLEPMAGEEKRPFKAVL